MQIYHFLLTAALLSGSLVAACTQVPSDRPHCGNTEFDQKVAGTIGFTVPTIGVQELTVSTSQYLIFDAREWEEFQVSHIPGARYLGYDDFQLTRLKGVRKDQPIVLYCSIGYRSEKIGEKLRNLGYTEVYNLYGSLFEWVNQGHPVEDGQGNRTNKVHTYNRQWSKWVDDQAAEKVW